ncbi:hypothetical protein EV424DRAFT_1352643 [Suillus variegatus]|nr:hypothetical protein EV424DRAFT_1352643 [Suillus variegatus]
MPQHQDPTTDDSFNSSSDNGSGSDSESDSDEELVQICTAIAPLPDTASPQDLHQALAIAQKLLLNTCGQCIEFLKRNALLEASASHGRKKLTVNELALAVKEDAIKAHGRKYSMTHCYKRSTESKCCTLLVNPSGAYTKFAPVLFPDPEKPSSQTFLKTAKLVQILRVSIFGKTSLSSKSILAGKQRQRFGSSNYQFRHRCHKVSQGATRFYKVPQDTTGPTNFTDT